MDNIDQNGPTQQQILEISEMSVKLRPFLPLSLWFARILPALSSCRHLEDTGGLG